MRYTRRRTEYLREVQIRMWGKWVLASLATALITGMLVLGCGDDPSPTPDPTPTAEPSPTPMTPRISVFNSSGGSIFSQCGPHYSAGLHRSTEDLTPNFLKWTPDGTRIVFDDPRGGPNRREVPDPRTTSDIYLLDAGGSSLRRIVDANPGYTSVHGTYADVR